MEDGINIETDSVHLDMTNPKNFPEPTRKLHPDLPLLSKRRTDDSKGLRRSLPSAGCRALKNDTYELTLPQMHRSYTEADMSNFVRGSHRRRPKSPTPIIQRVPKTENVKEFNALNRKFKPIPQLLEKPLKDKEFGKKNMTIWEQEVKKIVPPRPTFATSSDWQAPPAASDDRIHYIYAAKPVFYKNLKYVVDRDFTVNPEWLSEKMSCSIYSPVYSTCALRYGWSC